MRCVRVNDAVAGAGRARARGRGERPNGSVRDWLNVDAGDFVEDARRQGDAADAQTLQNRWRFAAPLKLALDFAFGRHADAAEAEDIADGDMVVLDSDHFGDVDDLAGAVLETGNLHHHLDGAGKLLQDDPRGDFEVGHQDHGL